MTRTLPAAACGLLCLSLLVGCGQPATQNAKPQPATTSKQASKQTPQKMPKKTAEKVSAKAEEEVPAIRTPRQDLPILVGVDETAIIRKTLQKKVSVNFVETPLTDVVAYLAKETKLKILLDQLALEEDGIATDEPIDFASKEVTVERVLNRVLEPMGCTWMIED